MLWVHVASFAISKLLRCSAVLQEAVTLHQGLKRLRVISSGKEELILNQVSLEAMHAPGSVDVLGQVLINRGAGRMWLEGEESGWHGLRAALDHSASLQGEANLVSSLLN
ncbi:hypothetical protein E2C01_024796 [Portunus trituberculatus]|uniref:Uncharacterized protein n=1 Tax=Portunus trituberculatus TaxID=210409 RepID=A0A5B7EE70_PORTR|nr:hypothetical protein [Portunus trituberculatus]